MRTKGIAFITPLLFVMFSLLPVYYAMAAEKLTVAVAANFALPMKEISKKFQAETGIVLQTTISSTGTLYAQIKNGATYDMFFAADSLRPELLFQQGLTSEPVIYAKGRAVLWTKTTEMCSTYKNYHEALLAKDTNKVGIANPKTAPYGTAIADVLQKTGMWDSVSGKLVYAGNIGQSFQYATLGAVSMSFIAASSAHSKPGKKGCYWPIPEVESVVQKTCIMNKSPRKESAEIFLNFLQSAQAKEIMVKYDYELL